MGNAQNTVDILCNHVAYSDEMLKFVDTSGGRKVFRFTILREEFSLLKSTFNYYRDYENYCFKGADYLMRYIKAYDYYTTSIGCWRAVDHNHMTSGFYRLK